MATEPSSIELTPMPVELVVRHAVDDSSDYNDGVDGYTGGGYDPETGILTVSYERAEGAETNPDDDDYNHSSVEYRFKLIPEIVAEVKS